MATPYRSSGHHEWRTVPNRLVQAGIREYVTTYRGPPRAKSQLGKVAFLPLDRWASQETTNPNEDQTVDWEELWTDICMSDHTEDVLACISKRLLEQATTLDLVRGDAIEFEFHCYGSYELCFWDGQNLVPKYEAFYDRGVPPPCFEAITDFPPGYFCTPHAINWLDRKLFGDQVLAIKKLRTDEHGNIGINLMFRGNKVFVRIGDEDDPEDALARSQKELRLSKKARVFPLF